MVSRDFISGFLMGFGLSSFCHGLYLMYVGNKLVQLSKTMDIEIEMEEMDEIDNENDVD
jgi:hypothetical protein